MQRLRLIICLMTDDTPMEDVLVIRFRECDALRRQVSIHKPDVIDIGALYIPSWLPKDTYQSMYYK